MKPIILEAPDGYIPGLARNRNKPKLAHLYKGDFSNPGLPMCRHGWTSDNRTGYSIWRNNIGPDGICRICSKRAMTGKDGVEAKEEA